MLSWKMYRTYFSAASLNSSVPNMKRHSDNSFNVRLSNSELSSSRSSRKCKLIWTYNEQRSSKRPGMFIRPGDGTRPRWRHIRRHWCCSRHNLSQLPSHRCRSQVSRLLMLPFTPCSRPNSKRHFDNKFSRNLSNNGSSFNSRSRRMRPILSRGDPSVICLRRKSRWHRLQLNKSSPGFNKRRR